MKKTTLALMLFITVPGLLLNAQRRSERSPEQQEKFRSMKIAFFTEQLELTTEEAEKFWPVYNAFEEKKSAMHRERRITFRSSASEIETLTDEQALAMIDKHIEFKKKDLQLEIEFYAMIKEVLPPKKVMKLNITETKFREHMLRQIRGEREGQRGKRPEDHP